MGLREALAAAASVGAGRLAAGAARSLGGAAGLDAAGAVIRAGMLEPGADSLTGVKKDELDTALGYSGNNAPGMRCNWFRSRGLLVGSGAVEAGCKAVIGQNLRLSRMRWTDAGADAIIALRCREASSQQQTICHAPHNQAGAA
jgi:hypothetical protein